MVKRKLKDGLKRLRVNDERQEQRSDCGVREGHSEVAVLLCGRKRPSLSDSRRSSDSSGLFWCAIAVSPKGGRMKDVGDGLWLMGKKEKKALNNLLYGIEQFSSVFPLKFDGGGGTKEKTL